MRIIEKFISLQGESTYAGLPCIFIRTAGCNINCNYCDTDYGQAMDAGQEEDIEDIIIEIKELSDKYNCKLIEITGGEPLVQDEEVNMLCRELINTIGKDVMILIETNGTMDIDLLELPNEQVTIIMDVKTPSSGMMEHNLLNNIMKLTYNDEIKFVVGTKKDLIYTTGVINNLCKDFDGQILISPIWNDELSYEDIAQHIIDNHPNVKMQIQLHKLIWDPDKRGV